MSLPNEEVRDERRIRQTNKKDNNNRLWRSKFFFEKCNINFPKQPAAFSGLLSGWIKIDFTIF
jgi:hypothetical protein